jgi:hypothetical protein
MQKGLHVTNEVVKQLQSKVTGIGHWRISKSAPGGEIDANQTERVASPGGRRRDCSIFENVTHCVGVQLKEEFGIGSQSVIDDRGRLNSWTGRANTMERVSG